MSSGRVSQCLFCEHRLEPVGNSYPPTQVCTAFGIEVGGIPDEIYHGVHDHRQAYEGDHGTRWSPIRPGVEFPERAVQSVARR